MKQILCSTIFVALLSLSAQVHASDWQIAFSQSQSGVVTAILSFPADNCGGGLYPVGVNTLVVSGQQISITSALAVADGLPPGSTCQTSTYSVSAVLGNLPDGRYDVTWMFDPPGDITAVYGSFGLMSGLLLQVSRDQVPSLSGAAVSILIVLLIVTLGLMQRIARQASRL
jgi:hypothetical protein